MADVINISTSSKSLINDDIRKNDDHQQPNGQKIQQQNENSNLNENYNSVKMKQQKYAELNGKLSMNKDSDDDDDDDDDDDGISINGNATEMPHHLTKFFQNKLKRKKKLSVSLTSVSDLVNQEKRTRIEGIQLNCRGKLQSGAGGDHQQMQMQSISAPMTPTHNHHHHHHHSCIGIQKMERVTTKPPIPPSRADRVAVQQNGMTKVPPPRLKRKLEENVSTIQRLNALTEQMRLEISELKQNLSSEKGAVRVLRAQNESEKRKWKNEVKKLQSTLEVLRKMSNLPVNGNNNLRKANESTDVPIAVAISEPSVSHELQKLTNEVIALKDTNRMLEEKKQITSDADRRKVADIRELKDSYEIRLTQLSKSAKTEISRLLEEIKTKERNIGQLKREVQMLQNKPISRNATKSGNTATATTSSTNTNTTQKNPAPIRVNRTNRRKDSRNVQHPNEVKKLKDFERTNAINKNLINNNNNNSLSNAKINGKENIHCNGISNNNSNKNNVIMNGNSNSNNNSKYFINSTCGGDKEYHSMPHEITERILGAHNDVHEYRSKDNNSDSDSALSSAPPSISPQPPSSASGLDTADIWQTIKNYSTDLEKVQKDLEMLQKENETLQTELNLARELIKESEKTALEANNSKKIQQLLERIKFLEQKENKLQKESHELREQNELLEFRILELEESNDKWSLQSNASPISGKDMWPGINKKDDVAIYAGDHTDSGVTSPHHHIDDRLNGISPSDLNILENLSNESLRERIISISKKPALDDEDRQCLQMVLQLIQNLDAISQGGSGSGGGAGDSLPTSGDEETSSLELLAKSRISDYSSASSALSARSTLIAPTSDSQQHIQQTRAKIFANTNSRIVATVLPYNSGTNLTTSTPTDSPSRRTRNAWNSSNLAESGVFEADFLSDSENSVYTQTDPADYCIESSSSASHFVTKDLCAEIQKLNKFREKIEECVTKNSNKVPVPQLVLSPSISDQKRILFYKERLELLESKVLIYESSGDLQAKRLADRLQREIQLEKLVKDLRDRVSFLESENSNLEEEKCEFEEAENDTRLRLQRLEVDLEILSQRNIELEMSREALGAKLKDCRSECIQLRENKSQCHSKIQHLEKDNQRVKENLNFLHNALPTLVLYNAYQFATTIDEQHQQQSTDKMGNTPSKNQTDFFSLALERDKLLSFCRDPDEETQNVDDNTQNRKPNKQAPSTPSTCPVVTPSPPLTPPLPPSPSPQVHLIQENEKLTQEILHLREELKAFRKQMIDLNVRHYEAMECADSHWVEIEKEYKEREATFRAKESNLKQKIMQLQECLVEDSRAATEKIMQLEESERDLKVCLQKLSKEHRDLLDEHRLILDEYQRTKDEYDELKEHAIGPARDAYEREKARNNSLMEEIRFVRKIQAEIEMRAKNELESMHARLQALNREYLQIEVTNSELREEVCTLENQIIEMQKHGNDFIDKIRCLTDEVRTKEDMCAILEKRLAGIEASRCTKSRIVQTCDRGCMSNSSTMISAQSLAQELNGSPVKRVKRDEPETLPHSLEILDGALNSLENCLGNLPSQEQFTNVAKDVESLADTLLSKQTDKSDEQILNKLEQEITEKLLEFHCKKMETEVLFTVYYPVKRNKTKQKTNPNHFGS